MKKSYDCWRRYKFVYFVLNDQDTKSYEHECWRAWCGQSLHTDRLPPSMSRTVVCCMPEPTLAGAYGIGRQIACNIAPCIQESFGYMEDVKCLFFQLATVFGKCQSIRGYFSALRTVGLLFTPFSQVQWCLLQSDPFPHTGFKIYPPPRHSRHLGGQSLSMGGGSSHYEGRKWVRWT